MSRYYGKSHDYGDNPGDQEARFDWISWRDGLCYPPPHHAPDRINYRADGSAYRKSLLTVICCDVISFFWVIGQTLRRRAMR